MSPIFLIIVPLVAAFLTMLIKPMARPVLVITVLINAIVAWIANQGIIVIGGFEPPYGISLLNDGYSFIAIVVVNTLFALLVMMNYKIIQKHATVLMLLLAALNGVLLTNDLFNLFVFLEITAISTYLLSTRDQMYKTTLHYLVIGTIGSGFYLLGLMLIYNMLGTLNLSNIISIVEGSDLNIQNLTIPFLFMVLGLAVEVKLFPVNSWVRSILLHADEVVAPLVGSIVSGAFLFVFGRLISQLWYVNETIGLVLTVLALVTLVFGELLAFRAETLRDLLLNSSIAQSGLVIILMINQLTYVAILAILANVFAKFIMYRIAGAFPHKFSEQQGVFFKHRISGITFTIAALSLVGMPLFFGFYVKLTALNHLFEIGNYIVPIFILTTAVLEGTYMIRALIQLWNPGKEGSYSNITDVTSYELNDHIMSHIGLALVAVVLLVLGLYPQMIRTYAEDAMFSHSQSIVELEQLGGTMDEH